MKILGNTHLIVMISLVTTLLILGTATSDDQTEVLTEETQRMTQKPTIMILGSSHLANPGMDTFNYKMDDVLAPKRQREIEVNTFVCLSHLHQPTKIAFERILQLILNIKAIYQAYLKGTYELQRVRK